MRLFPSFQLNALLVCLMFFISNVQAAIEGPSCGIQAEVVEGGLVSINFRLSNTSESEATQSITLDIPSELDWLSVGSTYPIPSIPAGDSTTVQLAGTVPASMSLGVHTGNLTALEQDAVSPIFIPIQITVNPSDGGGILEVLVENELTYLSPGFPRVECATVSLFDPIDGELIKVVTSDADGSAKFYNLAAGNYILRVEADAHLAAQRIVPIVEGSTYTDNVFIQLSEVSYTWTVKPTEVDETNVVTLDSEFTSTVPRPDLSIDPSFIDLEEVVSDGITQVTVNATNHALVSVDNLKLDYRLPVGVSVPSPVTVSEIPPQSSILLPIDFSLGDLKPADEGDGIDFIYSSGQGDDLEYQVETLTFVPTSPPPPETSTVDVEQVVYQSVEAVKVGTAYRLTIPITNNAAYAMVNLALSFQILNQASEDNTSGFTVDSIVPSSIASGSSDTISVLITPSADVAGSQNQFFSLEGTVDYLMDGSQNALPIESTLFEVLPLPRLRLKYFSPLRPISGDEAFTTSTVEPSEPFPVAVMLTNSGSGTARKVRLFASQPNLSSSNVLNHFQQIGLIVDDLSFANTLNTEFDDVEPGETKIARHLWTSALSGLLSSGSVSTSVANSSGGLIAMGDLAFESVSSHDAIKVVRDPRSDGIAGPSFLTDENKIDDLILPDTVHFADGTTAPVNRPVTSVSLVPTFATRSGKIALSGTTSGFAYFELPEPSGGTMQLASVLRHDGSTLDLDNNVWITRVLTSGPGEELLYTRTLHVFDHDPVGSYTLIYGNNTPSVQSVADQLGSEQVLFSFTPQASDTDSDPPLWSLGKDAPSSMDIDPVSGTLSWTPGETEGGQTFPITIIATDANTPFGSDSVTFDLTIQERNFAPDIEAADLTVIAGLPFQYQASASDADLPAQTLRYSFPGSSPSGMTISEGGLVEWNIPQLEKEDTLVVSLAVDDGVKADTANLRLNVKPASGFQPQGNLFLAKPGLYVFQAEDLPYHETEVWGSVDLDFWERIGRFSPSDTGTLNFEFPEDYETYPKYFFQFRFPDVL